MKAIAPSVRTKKARERRKAHPNRRSRRQAPPPKLRRANLNSPILTSAQMRAAEGAAFARGIEVEARMDKAGAGVSQAVSKFFPNLGRCLVFGGKGHNAGDALVAAQCLRRRGWKIEVRLAFKESDCRELMRKKLENMRRRPPEILGTKPLETADLGITHIELWVYVADWLSATQDAIEVD